VGRGHHVQGHAGLAGLRDLPGLAAGGDDLGEAGRFSSPNKKVPASAYPDPITRRTATALAKAKTFRFDLSDLQPASFGGTPGQGEWKDLQDFLKNPKNVDGTAAQLEKDAAKAYKSGG
jgi:alpha-glucoside transport system substrate-binding protein